MKKHGLTLSVFFLPPSYFTGSGFLWRFVFFLSFFIQGPPFGGPRGRDTKRSGKGKRNGQDEFLFGCPRRGDIVLVGNFGFLWEMRTAFCAFWLFDDGLSPRDGLRRRKRKEMGAAWEV